jgi:hypothetical protein
MPQQRFANQTGKRIIMARQSNRSPLELDTLANQVTDETTREARLAGGSETDQDIEEARLERASKIDLMIKERQVPRNVAEIMVDKGYSKGTAHRIVLDAAKRVARAREAAAAAGEKAAA